MAIITITSDWGAKDYYAAAVKGTILSMLPTATIVDVTHEIEPFNVAQAGFTLKNCYRCFPPGTIHIIAVEKNEPFATGVWQLTGEVLDLAERINEAALERYKKCRYTGVWPTGYEDVRLIDSL